MATYKAEFLSHYYKSRRRPLHAYAFGLIHVWSRLAQIAPSFVNFVNRAPFISDVVKAIIGIAPQRRDACVRREKSFKSWFRAREPTARQSVQAGKRVILWPDTFNNYFHPETAKAAVEVLEDAGFEVVVPHTDLCCGRPLYDYGMLDTAKRWLAQILTTLRDEIEAGTPMVGLEPSCTAVFRDELTEMFPQKQDGAAFAETNIHARRISDETRAELSHAETAAKGAHARPLSSQGDHENRL